MITRSRVKKYFGDAHHIFEYVLGHVMKVKPHMTAQKQMSYLFSNARHVTKHGDSKCDIRGGLSEKIGAR